MSKLRAYAVNPGRLVSQARQIFSSKQKYTFVVEGETDYRLLRQWLVDKNARIEKVDGKDNVKDVWEESTRKRVNQVICVADVDYDFAINAKTIDDDRFLYVSSGTHVDSSNIETIDIESMLVRSNAFNKVIANKYRGTDLYDSEFKSRVSALRENLRNASAILGAYRAADMAYVKANGRSPIGGELPVTTDYYDAVKVELDTDKLRTMLSRSSRVTGGAMSEVFEKAERLQTQYSNGWQLCRGHDLTEMLGLHLSSYMDRYVSSREVEEDLRLACELSLLKGTRFGAHLTRLEERVGKPFLSAD